jgi:hypothetical protein
MASPQDLGRTATAVGLPAETYTAPVGSPPPDTPPGTGWRVFAGVMLFIGSAVNVFWGIAGLTHDAHLDASALVLGTTALWGAVMLVVASVQFVTVLLILARSRLGALLGIAFAVVGILVQLPVLSAYPLWSLLVIAADGLVIYALAVHGGDREQGPQQITRSG